jgi:hypothetical protein
MAANRTGRRTVWPALASRPAGNLPHHVDNGASKCGVFNAHERLGESESSGGSEEVGNIVWRTHLLATRFTRWSPWVFKEKRNRYLKGARDLLQSTGADAVRALFVLLHLLERHAECVRQLGLAH